MALGGDAAVAELTGSVPTPRFTGPQISKIALQQAGPLRAYIQRHIGLLPEYLLSPPLPLPYFSDRLQASTLLMVLIVKL